MKTKTKKPLKTGSLNKAKGDGFNPFSIVKDEEFCRNMTSIIAYYQISKGEGKQRFTGSPDSKHWKLAFS